MTEDEWLGKVDDALMDMHFALNKVMALVDTDECYESPVGQPLRMKTMSVSTYVALMQESIARRRDALDGSAHD